MLWLKRSKVHCVLQARRKNTEEKLKRVLSGQSDGEKTHQAKGHDSHIVEKEKWEEALLMKDQQIFAMQTAIEERERKIRDFQESNLRKAQQVSAFQAALNRKERECRALEEGKLGELKAMKVLLAEKEGENVKMRARLLQKWDQDEEAFQLVEEMEDAFKNGVEEGALADNQGEELLQTTAQGDFMLDIVEAQTGEEFFLTQVNLPVANFPESAAERDANGNMICLSSDTVHIGSPGCLVTNFVTKLVTYLVIHRIL